LDGHPALLQKLALSLDNSSRIVVSIVSLWEITIKSSLNKIELSFSLGEIRDKMSANQKFKMLDISFDHLNTLSTLPHIHGDPFDRLLIAQAITENLTIISADRHFLRVFWFSRFWRWRCWVNGRLAWIVANHNDFHVHVGPLTVILIITRLR